MADKEPELPVFIPDYPAVNSFEDLLESYDDPVVELHESSGGSVLVPQVLNFSPKPGDALDRVIYGSREHVNRSPGGSAQRDRLSKSYLGNCGQVVLDRENLTVERVRVPESVLRRQRRAQNPVGLARESQVQVLRSVLRVNHGPVLNLGAH